MSQQLNQLQPIQNTSSIPKVNHNMSGLSQVTFMTIGRNGSLGNNEQLGKFTRRIPTLSSPKEYVVPYTLSA